MNTYVWFVCVFISVGILGLTVTFGPKLSLLAVPCLIVATVTGLVFGILLGAKLQGML